MFTYKMRSNEPHTHTKKILGIIQFPKGITTLRVIRAWQKFKNIYRFYNTQVNIIKDDELFSIL